VPKYCSENEKVKRAYTFYLEAASGKQNATIDSALRAIAGLRNRPVSSLSASLALSRPDRSELASLNQIPMASC
jgi:hypothetical protein